MGDSCLARCLHTGWRCLHRLHRDHGDFVIMHHQWEHSFLCARSSSKVPIAPMGKLRPDGRLTNCSLFAGRWCLCLGRHSVNRELRDLLQQCWRCARSSQKFPMPRWDFHICFAHVFAGWRCLRPGWHGDLVIVHHHWQHSYSSACSRSKFPIAPMGKLRPDGKLTMFAR